MLVFFTEAFRFLRSQYYMSLIFAVSWKALELCRPASPAPLPSSDLSNANSSNGRQLVLNAPFFTDLTANDLSCHPNLFQLKLTEYIRLLSYVDEFMSLRRAPGGADFIYPSPAIQSQSQLQTHSLSHQRSCSQGSSSTSASSSLKQRAALTAATTTGSPHDTSTIYSGDGDAEDSTSPRWTEDYFWVYFGEKELEGESPQTTTTTTTTTTNPTTISNNTASSSSNSDSSSIKDSNTPGHEDGDRHGLELTSGGGGRPPPYTSPSKYDESRTRSEPSIMAKTGGKEENSSEDSSRADTFQNMLDCLPLLGE